VDRLEAFVVLGPKISGGPYSEQETAFTITAANQFAVTLENLRLAAEIRSRRETEERFRSEIELARQVQARLLPNPPPAVAGLDIAGICLPALAVGGDYFDFFAMKNEGLGIAIADVSGKGLGAAILMSNLQAGLRTAVGAGVGVEEALRSVNGLLCDLTSENRFASFFFGVVHRSRRVLRYLNAGHNSPLLFRRDARKPVSLASTAPVLGIMQNWQGREREIELGPGDVLLAYTDGLSEANNPTGGEFGEGRIAAATRVGIESDLDAQGLACAVVQTVKQFAGGTAYVDDLTLMVLRVLD